MRSVAALVLVGLILCSGCLSVLATRGPSADKPEGCTTSRAAANIDTLVAVGSAMGMAITAATVEGGDGQHYPTSAEIAVYTWGIPLLVSSLSALYGHTTVNQCREAHRKSLGQ